MNIDIRNYGKFHLTSHGGRRFELFDRDADRVYTITEDEYREVIRDHDPELVCYSVARRYWPIEGDNRIDVA